MPDPYGRTIMIHCCKDRTLSYRNRLQPIFNGAALPVFSVNNVDEARSLISMVSNRQYEEHPLWPGDVWWKIDLGPSFHELDPKDLKLVTAKLERAYDLLVARKAETAG